jgi:hypothetical protein
MENNRLDRDYENEFPLKSFLEKYLIHWHWFLTCACVSLILAFYILIYRTRISGHSYNTGKDEMKGKMLSEMSAFADLGLSSGLKVMWIMKLKF